MSINGTVWDREINMRLFTGQFQSSRGYRLSSKYPLNVFKMPMYCLDIDVAFLCVFREQKEFSRAQVCILQFSCISNVFSWKYIVKYSISLKIKTVHSKRSYDLNLKISIYINLKVYFFHLKNTLTAWIPLINSKSNSNSKLQTLTISNSKNTFQFNNRLKFNHFRINKHSVFFIYQCG